MFKKGVGKLKLRIDLKIIVVIMIFLITGQLKIYSVIMFFCFLHELGHIVVAKIFKMKIERIEVLPCGFSSLFSSYCSSETTSCYLKQDSNFYMIPIVDFATNEFRTKVTNNTNKRVMKEILVAIAGPMTSLILALIFKNIDEVNLAIVTKQEIFYTNILILIFNLLPLYPLDGGRILKGILSISLIEQKAENITNKVSSATIIILTIVSSIAVYYFKNIAIFLACIFLWNIVLGNKFKQNVKVHLI